MAIKKTGRYYIVKMRGCNVTFFNTDRLLAMLYASSYIYGVNNA
jgi:hypothetical protein